MRCFFRHPGLDDISFRVFYGQCRARELVISRDVLLADVHDIRDICESKHIPALSVNQTLLINRELMDRRVQVVSGKGLCLVDGIGVFMQKVLHMNLPVLIRDMLRSEHAGILDLKGHHQFLLQLRAFRLQGSLIVSCFPFLVLPVGSDVLFGHTLSF